MVVQLKVLPLPCETEVGLAVNDDIVGGGVLTVTVAVRVTDPALFVAVRVYVVVDAGETVVEPVVAEEVNEPGVIEICVAPVIAQLRVLFPPDAMDVGLAANDEIDGCAAVTLIVTVLVVDPLLFVAVRV